MDPNFCDFSDSINGFKFYDETVFPGFDSSFSLVNGFNLKHGNSDFDFTNLPFLVGNNPYFDTFPPSSSVSSELDSPDDREFSDSVLKYINQILMEENMEDKPSMFHDPLALQATEKSLYETIGEKYPPSPNKHSLYFDQNIDSPDDNINPSNHNGSAFPSAYFEYSFQSIFQTNSHRSLGYINNLSDSVNGQMNSSHSILGDCESVLQFKRGMEEARKFLPSGNQLIIDLEKYELPLKSREEALEADVKVEKDEKEDSPNGATRRKNHFREERDSGEERSSKQLAVYVEESELSEMFDKVLLFEDTITDSSCIGYEESQSGTGKILEQNGQPNGSSNSGKTRSNKKGDKEDFVDLRALLINCAQSVAADDRRTANEQLKHIGLHSSPSGDATQRLAYIFANGLKARLAGTGSQIHAALIFQRISAVEKLKAYQLYFSACPFKMMAIFYATKTIVDLAMNARNKALHVIDFGILYGFQWPIFIQRLSMIPGGPPKLRITGIEFPQPGFRPAELVEETGRRLAKYCDRFNVPFQYHAVAQKWDTIKIKDLNICENELLVVNSMLRFHHLFDETIMVNSPRDAVLKLIRKMNPDIFIHSIVNGSYNAPFFVTRFREALFHYSAWCDMLDVKFAREDQQRMNFEKEFYGREVMNVVACEGFERVERPETYKQWQIRTMRAGFRLEPLDREFMKRLRWKVKTAYHKDFVIDEDGHWMLQGWKGRILLACSCWVPT